MKKLKYFLMAALCATFTACMDGDYDTPSFQAPFGNNDLKETNVLTIKEFKQKFKNECNNEGSYKLITDDIQIKGYVTANDIQGNMYNEISIQDETGAIFIAIAQGGINGYLPEGTEILVDLKGLYIGNYRKSASIGTPYTDRDGEVSVSRMNRVLWQSHFKLTGGKKILKPALFADGSAKTTWNIEEDGGKLGIIKNVSFKNGGYYNSDTKSYVSNVKFTSESTYAFPNYSTSWYFKEQPDGQSGGVQIYTSNFADFAAMRMPQGKVNITGVFKRYRDQWEIIIRTIDDVEEVK